MAEAPSRDIAEQLADLHSLKGAALQKSVKYKSKFLLITRMIFRNTPYAYFTYYILSVNC